MKFIYVLVEGQAEETFLRDILSPYCEPHHHLTPIIFQTRRDLDGTTYRGGGLSYEKVKSDIQKLLKNTSASLVTTMFDFYALGQGGFPGWATKSGNCLAQVKQVEQAINQDIGNPKFRSYLALHEYEALLFSQPLEIANHFPSLNSSVSTNLTAIRTSFATPEHINSINPPSIRIKNLIVDYRKVADGNGISEKIGIATMRQECKHFDEWVSFVQRV